MNLSADRLKAFDRSVKNKFDVYNSLFLNLPTGKIQHVGILIPLLHRVAEQGLADGREPVEILDNFFETHTEISTEKDRIEFMFNVIQYVERQVVLFDSVEDAAFPYLQGLSDELNLRDFIRSQGSEDQAMDIYETLSTFSARLVLTAHPTQFYPQPVLDIISSLRSMIMNDELNDIDQTLQQLGMTSLLNAKKPTPFQEAQNLIYYLKYVYYDAIGELYAKIKHSVSNETFENPNIIKLGFWPGGDRDGNPFVTSDTTLEVADDLRMSLMKCYYWDIKKLAQKLTFRDIDEIISKLRLKLYDLSYKKDRTISYEEIINSLQDVRTILISEYNSLYLDELDLFIDKVKIFKTHFATLDIRQDHSAHRDAINEILRVNGRIKKDLSELPEEILLDILTEQELRVKTSQFADESIKETIKTISELALIQRKNGEEGCNRYIISHAEDQYSVLFVFALLRWIWGETFTMDIIPLFESMVGMQSSETIMGKLLTNRAYRDHVKRRGDRQTVMLGFSDGTKDGGYLQANWSIFKTKEGLSKVCSQLGIKAIFFDGRGGPPARGGGKTSRFYASQSNQISNHEIQLTIQGQTITSRYGTKEHFTYNCEQLMTAGLSNRLFKQKSRVTDDQRALMEILAKLSHAKYLSLKNHPLFIPYLENKGTLKYYAEANIGSRPDSRNPSAHLNLEDLRAIPFVGSWSQMKQNVPGYFGIGAALKEIADQGQLSQLQQLFNTMPFFKALILNSMMSLFKCYFELTAYFAKDKTYGDFWKILHDEYQLSKEMTLLVSGYQELMEEEPASKRSINIRKQIVLPLLLIQQVALQKIEQKSEWISSYEKIVQRSLYGNINASRNSA